MRRGRLRADPKLGQDAGQPFDAGRQREAVALDRVDQQIDESSFLGVVEVKVHGAPLSVLATLRTIPSAARRCGEPRPGAKRRRPIAVMSEGDARPGSGVGYSAARPENGGVFLLRIGRLPGMTAEDRHRAPLGPGDATGRTPQGLLSWLPAWPTIADGKQQPGQSHRHLY